METPALTPLSIIDKFNNWIKESISLKLMSIGLLILILLIPQAWIESIIVERQNRADEVIHEIAAKWSGPQTITGPVLVIPYIRHDRIDNGKDGIRIVDTRSNAFFLPEELTIDGTVQPQVLHRGIFESAVYESSILTRAKFLTPDFLRLNIEASDVIWKDASLVVGISDLRGISDNPRLMAGTQTLTAEPSNDIPVSTRRTPANGSDMNETGVTIRLPWKSAEDFAANVSIDIRLKGSEQLYFSPVGKTTSVSMKGPWSSPAFDGEFLPAKRTVTPTDFTAEWKILHFNRPFAQSWIGSQQTVAGANFGVRFLIPVDQYQKSIRTAKYGILVILLTFVSLFMVELIRKVRIHPVQYILVGSALIIYYVLLLSLSEHIGYDYAYLAATIATIGLVSAYALSFLPDRRTVVLFTSWMVGFYGFIFVIIQEQDYSLLIGSVGLFLIVGAIMYFSRKITWYR